MDSNREQFVRYFFESDDGTAASLFMCSQERPSPYSELNCPGDEAVEEEYAADPLLEEGGGEEDAIGNDAALTQTGLAEGMGGVGGGVGGVGGIGGASGIGGGGGIGRK